MTSRIYLSTDASAPVLTGVAGSLTALLDAVLVNGYGSQPAAGWTINQTATNKRGYKQGTGSNGFCLDVDDSASGGGGAREARMRGYETMSAVGAGTYPFPTTVQGIAGGVICRKSTSADATARPWYLLADATCFYLFVDTGDTVGYSMGFQFGDIYAYKSGDAYSTMISGRAAENSGSAGQDFAANVCGGTSMLLPLSTEANATWMDRIWTGVSGSIPVHRVTSGFAYTTGNTSGGNGAMGGSYALLAYPNGPDSGLELSPLWIAHHNSLRGYQKGVWAPCHNQPLGHGQTFNGSGNMAGKTFLALNIMSNNNYGPAQGQIILETSNTWS